MSIKTEYYIQRIVAFLMVPGLLLFVYFFTKLRQLCKGVSEKMNIIPRKVNEEVDWDWILFSIVMGVLLAACLGLLGIIAYAYYLGLWNFLI